MAKFTYGQWTVLPTQIKNVSYWYIGKTRNKALIFIFCNYGIQGLFQTMSNDVTNEQTVA